jgi:hemoglobin/transferrin/lactoferrin receptor protein
MQPASYRVGGLKVGTLAALLLLPLTTLSAQTDADAAATSDAVDPSTTITETVTVVASRGERTLLETPGSVSVMTAEQIEREGANDLRDLLRFEPALLIDGDPARFGLGGFVIRGMGGNRVQTRIDGVPTGEEFSFGPLTSPRMGLDLDVLAGVEIVKNGGSSLYGSDALGGVVAFSTKDPLDLITHADGRYHLGARLGYDGRTDEQAIGLSVAMASESWQFSLLAAQRDGHETDTMGEDESLNNTRTAPNPQDRDALDGLAKLVFLPSERMVIKLGVESYDGDTYTDVLTSRGVQNLGFQFGPGNTYRIETEFFDADDTRERSRVSIDLSLETPDFAIADRWHGRIYDQDHSMEQLTVEQRSTTTGGPALGPLRTSFVLRTGTFDFEQEARGGELQLDLEVNDRARLVYGVSYSQDRFDTLRNVRDVNPTTGAPIPSSTPYPTKYFPRSQSDKTGVFAQVEIDVNDRLRLIPGIRYDRYELDADQTDAIYFSGNPGSPIPADSTDAAWSPRLALVYGLGANASLFAQAAAGFRAPPFSDINAGFTNLALGYMQLPAPDLEPEESDSYELGWRYQGSRGSLSLAVFSNHYDNFIETVALGFNPTSGLLEYKALNLSSARIEGFEAQGDVRFGGGFSLRGAFALMDGENGESDQPLNSIAPARLVLGLGWRASAGRYGAELIATAVDSKDADDLDRTVVNQFAAPSYQMVDLTAYWEIGRGFSVQGGVWNVLDEKAWDWGTANGLSQTSLVLDRYTSPGRTGSLALRWRR